MSTKVFLDQSSPSDWPRRAHWVAPATSRILWFVMLLCLLPLLSACGVTVDGAYLTTRVVPLPGEDLASSCSYDLRIFEPSLVQHGVLVIFERGDSAKLFSDVQVQAMATNLHFSMISAHQCNSAAYDDLQSDPAKGPGRALFQALTQFAQETGHPELEKANVVLYGFSAAGVLAAEIASFAPNRTLGVITYAAGTKYQNLGSFTPNAASLGVPSLLLANSDDEQAGTARSQEYFAKGRSRGAIWAYAVQQGVGHCCNITTRAMILPWIPSIVQLRGGGLGPLQRVAPTDGVVGSFVCSPNGKIDSQGQQDCGFTSAAVNAPISTREQSVWLPGSIPAQEWLSWVATSHP